VVWGLMPWLLNQGRWLILIEVLRLKNWRSHASLELQFKPGLNVIVGRMGAGKSSILNAISFALFGTFPELSSKKLSIGDVIRDGQHEASVELVFKLDARYSVLRVVDKRGTRRAELRREGKLLETRSNAITQFIEQRVGFDYNVFSKAVYVAQNELMRVLSLTPGERKKELDHIFGIDELEDVRANALFLKNSIRKRIESLERSVNLLQLEEVRKALEEVRGKLEEVKAEVKRLEEERARLEQRAKEKKQQLDALERVRAERERLERKRSELEGERKTLQEQLKYLNVRRVDGKVYEKVLEVLRQLKSEEKRLEQAVRAERDTLSALRVKAQQVIKNREELKVVEQRLKALGDVEVRLQEAERALEQLKSKRAALLQEREQLAKTLPVLKRMGAQCPVCGQPLSDEHRRKVLAEFRDKVEDVKRGLAELRNAIEDKENDVRALRRSVEEKNKLLAVKERLKVEQLPDVKAQEVKVKALEQQLANVKEQIEVKRQEEEEMRRALEDQKKKERLSARLKVVEKMLMDVREQLNSMKGVEEWKRVQEEYAEVWERFRQVSAVMNNKLKTLSQWVYEERRLSDQLREWENVKKEVETLRAKHEDVSQLYTALLTVQEELRTEIVKSINALMYKLWQTLYPYDDYSAVRLAVEDGNYVLQFLKAGRWVSVDRGSGGEKALAALCFRVAVSALFSSKLNYLFLDEPTHNLDKSAVEALGQAIAERLPSFIPQIFVISHDENLVSGAGNVYAIKKEEGITRVIGWNDVVA